MKVRAKLCGLTTQDDIDAAATAGAAYVGLVFFEKSPRNVTIETARGLALHAPVGLEKLLWW
jgi:phosphoribosylanthranilate isomerase